MRNVQWQTKESFIFPSAIGAPTKLEKVSVTPRFTIDRSADNLRMTGIYHLAANVEFDAEVEVSKESATDSAILIEDVDLEGKLGYFEYAVPFNIDLPPEADDPLNMITLNTSHEIGVDGELAIIWEVECTYKEVIVVPDQILAEEAEREAKKTEVHLENETQSEEQAKSEQASKVVEEQAESEQVAKVVVENTVFSEGDEVLSFISELDDGISSTLFRLNDVLVQSES